MILYRSFYTLVCIFELELRCLSRFFSFSLFLFYFFRSLTPIQPLFFVRLLSRSFFRLSRLLCTRGDCRSSAERGTTPSAAKKHGKAHKRRAHKQHTRRDAAPRRRRRRKERMRTKEENCPQFAPKHTHRLALEQTNEPTQTLLPA